MLTASVVPVPSSQRLVEGSVNIPIASWPICREDGPELENGNTGNDPRAVAGHVVDALNSALARKDHVGIAQLFLASPRDSCYWRDHLAMTWDLRTAKGQQRIVSFLDEGHHLLGFELDESTPTAVPQMAAMRPDGSVRGIQFFTKVTTKFGSGRGVVRMVREGEVGRGPWRIWTKFTSIDELKGHEEPLGPNRANGVQHGAQVDRKNWLDRRREEESFKEMDPDVLIIGCGQAGLSVHARLKMLGVQALTIDKNEEIGDNWRKRYHQLVLHDPIWYDHMPYVPFPEFWPVFTPKDKLANFLRSYAQMLELNVWTSTTLESSSWDQEKKRWTVVLKRRRNQMSNGVDAGHNVEEEKEETRTLHPKHIVQATGHSGKKNYPDFPGMDKFEGSVLCHSSEFRGATPQPPPPPSSAAAPGQQQQQQQQAKKRKAVVIGSCNSALDIAQDFYEHGYDVTVVQRSTTAIMSSETVLSHLLGPLYREGGPSVSDADLLCWSLPSELFKAINADITALQESSSSSSSSSTTTKPTSTSTSSPNDAEILRGLNAAGFRTDRGPDDCGLWFKYLQRGGGYYIDVGTSRLIIEGKIRVHHGSGVAEILPGGLRLDDGTVLDADEIVAATGYQNMRTATEAIFGSQVAAQVPTVWGFDGEGETRTMWRRSGHPGLWLHGGNLAMCRYFSRVVALQIKAQLEGMAE